MFPDFLTKPTKNGVLLASSFLLSFSLLACSSDSNKKEKLLSNLKWLEKASIFDFKKNTIKVAKTYFGEENVSPNGNYNLTI